MMLHTVIGIMCVCSSAEARERQPTSQPAKWTDPCGWLARTLQAPDEENAFAVLCRHYQSPALAPHLNHMQDSVAKQLDGVVASATTWQPGEHPELATWLERIEPDIRLYDEVRNRLRFWCVLQSEQSWRWPFLLPHATYCRTLPKALLAKAWCGSHIDTDGFLLAHATALQLANQLARNPLTNDRRSSWRIRQMVWISLISAYNQGTVELPQLEQMLLLRDPVDAVDCRDTMKEALNIQLVAEFGNLRELCRPQAGLGGPRFDLQRLIERNQMVMLAVPGGHQLSAFSNSQVQALAKTDPLAARDTLVELNTSLGRLLERPFTVATHEDVVRLQGRAIQRCPVLRLVIQSEDRTFVDCYVAEAHRRGRACFRAFFSYCVTHSKPPRHVEDLGLAEDEVSDPFWGERLVLKERQGDYLLYSIGPDGKNNDGDDKGDIVLWRLEQRSVPMGGIDRGNW